MPLSRHVRARSVPGTVDKAAMDETWFLSSRRAQERGRQVHTISRVNAEPEGM